MSHPTNSRAMRRAVGLCVLLVLGLSPQQADAQVTASGSVPGMSLRSRPRIQGDRWPLMFTWSRNKVSWWDFDWRASDFPSSTLYYYRRAEPVARMAASLVQESDRVLQDRFQYDLQTYTADKRIPKIIYTSHHTFEQTNTISQSIPEGLGGFTEYVKGRVVFPYTGSNADFRHVLEHENTHAHMIHKLKHVFKAHSINDTSRLLPQLWFSEGLAEYESIGRRPEDGSHRLDVQTEMYLKDGVINDTLPTLREMRLYPDYARVYKYGHAMVQYLGARYGAGRLEGMLSQWQHLYPNRNSFTFLRRRPLDTFDPLNPGVHYIDPPFIRVGDTDYPVEKIAGAWRVRRAGALLDTLNGVAVSERVERSENIDLEGTWYRIIETEGGFPAFYRPDSGVVTVWDGREAEHVIRTQKESYEDESYRLLSFDKLAAWWFDTTMEDLTDSWHREVRGYYAPWLEGRTRVTDYPRVGEGATELWPTLSDDGRLVLYKAYRDNYVYEMLILDRASGQQIRLAQDNTPEVESLHVLSEGGDVLALGDGRYVAAFTAQRRHRDVIYLQDLVREPEGRIRKAGRLRIAYDPAPTDLVGLSGVRFAAGGDTLLFSGLRLDGNEDIYRVGLAPGSVVERLTADLASDRTPILWGDRIYFASDRAGSDERFEYHLFSMRSDGSDLVQLTEGPGSEKNPTVGKDGMRLFFESDAGGTSNIYEWTAQRGIRQVTDVATGVFAPAPVGTDSLLVSGFDEQEFHLFLIPVDPGTPPVAASADTAFHIGAVPAGAEGPVWVERPWTAADIPSADRMASGTLESRPYSARLSLDDFYASSEFGGFRTYNTAVFGTEVRFSDLLGEHVLGIAAWNGPRKGFSDFSWVTSYWNQKNRTKWGGSVYRVSGVYYNLVRQDFYLRERAGLNTQFNYPFNQFADLDLFVGGATERRSLGTVDGQIQFREAEVGIGFTRDVSGWGPQGPHRGWVFSAFYDHIFKVEPGFPTFSNYIVGDIRGYLPLHRYVVAAGRLAGGYSGGIEPEFFFLGGGLFLRGYWDLYSLYGSSYRLVNTELRLQPLEILGVKAPKMFEQGGWPFQVALFAEAGEAEWKGGSLPALGSAGASVRLTLALPFVLEYAWYQQRFWDSGPHKQGFVVTLLF